jgi:hypothetical protein
MQLPDSHSAQSVPDSSPAALRFVDEGVGAEKPPVGLELYSVRDALMKI